MMVMKRKRGRGMVVMMNPDIDYGDDEDLIGMYIPPSAVPSRTCTCTAIL